MIPEVKLDVATRSNLVSLATDAAQELVNRPPGSREKMRKGSEKVQQIQGFKEIKRQNAVKEGKDVYVFRKQEHRVIQKKEGERQTDPKQRHKARRRERHFPFSVINPHQVLHFVQD